MSATAVDSNYPTATPDRVHTQPATAPDVQATKTPHTETSPAGRPAPQPQQATIYFFDVNLGRHVNILV